MNAAVHTRMFCYDLYGIPLTVECTVTERIVVMRKGTRKDRLDIDVEDVSCACQTVEFADLWINDEPLIEILEEACRDILCGKDVAQ